MFFVINEQIIKVFRSVLAQRWCYDFICVCHLLFFLSMDLCLDRHPYVGLNFIYRLSLFVIVCMLLTVSHLYKLTGNYNTNELYCVSSLYKEWVCVLLYGPALQGWHCHQTIQMSLQKPLHTCTYSAFHSPLLMCLHLFEWTFTDVSTSYYSLCWFTWCCKLFVVPWDAPIYFIGLLRKHIYVRRMHWKLNRAFLKMHGSLKKKKIIIYSSCFSKPLWLSSLNHKRGFWKMPQCSIQ